MRNLKNRAILIDETRPSCDLPQTLGFPEEEKMNEYLSVLKNYAKFDGRARRREYWMFTLVNVAVYFVLNILATQVSPYIGFVALAYMLGILVPSIAVAIRRMHDIGKSGWWVLIALVPLIGGIWFLVLSVTAGQSGSNAYGADPKA